MKVERVIVLSWIQGFFQKLKKIDEDTLDHVELPSIKNENEYYHENKKVESKIAYQYPKGKFRFPLIPDEVYAKNSIKENIKKPQAEKIVNHSVEGRNIYKEKNKKTASPNRSSGPFRPTEIPSPVFGFQRPKNQKAEVVEHELSHFIRDPLYNQENRNESVPRFECGNESPLSPDDLEENIIDTPSKVQIETNIIVNDDPILVEDIDKTLSIAEYRKEEITEEYTISEEITSLPIQEEIEQEKPKRSHLPFNVLMLKQDKKNWEQKRIGVEEKTNIEHNLLEEKVPEVIKTPSPIGTYHLPALQLLKPPVKESMDQDWVTSQQDILNLTLENFNVGAKVVNVTQGPSVTRFEVQPEPGVKVNKVTNLTDDIKLSLAARDIRMEAPIPGKHTIGIEVPNLKSRPVFISEIIQSNIFRQAESPLTAVLGLDISGNPIITDLKKMPHGLIAGATGSGKSVCINSILMSLLYKASPEDLKLLLIDPKMVELAPYNFIPHLVSPVITDVKAATSALKWAVDEMERRYELFAHAGVRDISRFNELAINHKRYSDKLPFIVIVIDELADLMMMSPADVEEAICRIAQKARACGIHLIIATQRPSVDVITGLIKANIPTRIAFSVSSQVDSRTIIDISGAEKLLGRGDMLFLENGSSKPVRIQGTFVSDEEIDLVVDHVRNEREPDYLFEQEELLKKAQISEDEDELFYEACEFVVEQGGASTSSLQRRFKIGYNRAARLMDLMQEQGFISSSNGSKPREVLITESDLLAMQDGSTI